MSNNGIFTNDQNVSFFDKIFSYLLALIWSDVFERYKDYGLVSTHEFINFFDCGYLFLFILRW